MGTSQTFLGEQIDMEEFWKVSAQKILPLVENKIHIQLC